MRSQSNECRKIWQGDRKDHKTYTVWKSVPLTIALTMLQVSDTLFCVFFVLFFFAIETYCTSSLTYLILDCKFIMSYINTTENPPDVGGWLGKPTITQNTTATPKKHSTKHSEQQRRKSILHFQRLYLHRFSSNDETVMSAGSLPLCIRAQDSNNGNVNEFSGLKKQTDSQGN